MTVDQVPAFIDVSASEFNSHPGRMLAEVAAGGVVRVTDRRMGLVRAYLTRELPAGLAPVADLIPEAVMANGLPPAPAGHKRCSTCHQVKPATADWFYRSARSPDGLAGLCKACQNEANAEYHDRKKARENGLAADRKTAS